VSCFQVDLITLIAGITPRRENISLGGTPSGWTLTGVKYKLGPWVIDPANPNVSIQITSILDAYYWAIRGVPAEIAADPRICRPAMWRESLTVSEVDVDRRIWEAEASYRSISGPTDETITFSVGEEQVTQFVHRGFIEGFAFLGEIPNDLAASPPYSNYIRDIFDGLINVSQSGEVEGVPVTVPRPQFTIGKVYPPGVATQCDFISAYVSLYGKVNDHTWRCFSEKQAKFAGLEINGILIDETCSVDPSFIPESRLGIDNVSFVFEVQPDVEVPFGYRAKKDNLGNYVLDGGNYVYEALRVLVKGWELFWTHSVQVLKRIPDGAVPDDQIEIKVTVPKFGQVCDIYEQADFSVAFGPPDPPPDP
jgi:hypothetical protein